MIPKLTRRSAVAMATVGLVAGCSGGRGSAPDAAAQADTSDVARQEREAEDSAALVTRYDAVAAAYPGLAARLAPLRADTAAHVRAFGGKATGTPPASASGGHTGGPAPTTPPGATTTPGGLPSPTVSATPAGTGASGTTPGDTDSATGKPAGGSTSSPSPGPAGSSFTVPGTSDKALAALAAAERALADRRAATLLDVPGDLARLLASVAAAGAGHVVLLGRPAGK
jgi:hypothetical protein